ncbi:hypothetical protein [Streptomyces sp. NBC_00140]|uniref:hypothetical protein n=1 Tax=Streptomyces sp. NBC_00140 TaxID=2975664 RepID=UPI00225AD08B|nr:hypothetical protein [Streptomyces sp. NBC_00140]MCX5328077.1 hypothetical protein [Streptomyces sp. NBC_00140]
MRIRRRTACPQFTATTGRYDTVAARLAAPDMSDAYGLRTMSSQSGGFGPLRYHCGAVWPHDTAIAGLARTGHPEAAARLIEGILDAAPAFDYRLPELWGGDARTDTPAPVPTRPPAGHGPGRRHQPSPS